MEIGLLNPAPLRFCTRGGAPERGLLPLPQMSRWGDTPPFSPPRGEPLTPKEGVTPKTPTVKNPPPQKGGKGVIYEVNRNLQSSRIA